MIKNRNIINKIIYLLMIIFIFFNMVGISNGISNKEENKNIWMRYSILINRGIRGIIL